MKKAILLLIAIIGIGWFFRYPLISPFVNSVQEESLVNHFMEDCVRNIPDLQKIESLAESNGWRALSDEELSKAKITPNGSPKGWETPDGMALTISIDVLPQQGKTASCSVLTTSASSELILSSLSKRIYLGQPYQNKKISPIINGRSWYVDNGGNAIMIGLTVARLKNFSFKDDAVVLSAGKKIN